MDIYISNYRYLPVFSVKLSWVAIMYETSGHVSALQSAFQIRMAEMICTWYAPSDWRHANLNGHLAKCFFNNPQFRNHLKRKLSILCEFGCLLMFSLIRLPDKAGPIAQHYRLQHQETSTSRGVNNALPAALWSTLDILEFRHVHVTSMLNFQFQGWVIIPNICKWWNWWS